MRCGAVVCFALMTASLKLASEDGVVAAEMLFYRSVFGMPLVLGWIMLGPGLGALRTKRPLAHLGRSALGITGILLNFQALILLPLADLTTISFTAPIFATLLSLLLLREQVGHHRLLAIVAGFVGVVIVMRPGADSGAISHLGIAFALAGAVGTAGVTITLRQLGATENVAAIVFWFFTASAVVSGIAMIFVAQAHDPFTWAMLVAGGLSGGAAQLLMTASLRAAPVSVVSPFDYLQIIWAIALGWLIWSDAPSLNTALGALLIGGSGLYTAFREHRLRRRELAAMSTPPQL